jgi:hypothetical protein
MYFLFPSSVKHLPNEEQVNLLIAITYKNKFPGFLHPNALTVSTPVTIGGVRYVRTTDPKELGDVIKNSPFLYMPYEYPKSYILNQSYDQVVGFVIGVSLSTYWFDKPISLAEIYLAEKNQCPIVIHFINIGRSLKCPLCDSLGAIDWVDDMKASAKYRSVPKERFILATHSDRNFLIDNKNILEYKGEGIFHPCPKCLGLGCESVLYMDGVKIKSVSLHLKVTTDSGDYDYDLLVRQARPTIVNMPDYYTPNFDL